MRMQGALTMVLCLCASRVVSAVEFSSFILFSVLCKSSDYYVVFKLFCDILFFFPYLDLELISDL